MSTVELVKTSMTSSVTGLLDVVLNASLGDSPAPGEPDIYVECTLRSCELTRRVYMGLFLANFWEFGE